MRVKYCGPTHAGSMRVRFGSLTSLNRLNELKKRGAPLTGLADRVLPDRSTEGVVENALPFRRLVPPPAPVAPSVRYRKMPCRAESVKTVETTLCFST